MKAIFKRSMAVLLALLMLACAVPLSAFAEEVTIVGISVPDITLIEGLYGATASDGENEWPVYTMQCANAVVELSDGRTATTDSDGWVTFDDVAFYVGCTDDQSYENQWGLGAYKITVTTDALGGFETTAIANVVETPVASVTVTDQTLVYQYEGVWETEYNEETDEYDLPWFRHYFWVNNYTVTMKDGTVYNSADPDFEGIPFDGSHYYGGTTQVDRHYLQTPDPQSYENQWELGEHTVTSYLLGYEVESTITVAENPVESITVQIADKIAGYHGYTVTDYNEETDEYDLEYYRYEIWPDSYTVTMKTGEVYSSNDDGFEGIPFGGSFYWPNYYSEQSYENQWGVGEHTATISLLGYEGTYSVNVIENPIASITVSPKNVVGNWDGYWTSDYNVETGQHDLPWFRYDTYPQYVVTMKNGEIYDSAAENFNGVFYEGGYYYPSLYEDQSYENQWEVGNTYTAEIELLGVSASYEVTVTESPIASVTVTGPSVIEGNGGYWDTVYNEETGEYDLEYYRYYVEPDSYTVTMKTGEVYSSNDDGFNGIPFNGAYHWPHVTSEQSYENPWGVGENTANFQLLGYTCDYAVTVTESPIAGITVEPVTLYEGMDGWDTYDWDEEGNQQEYFYYEIIPQCTVTLKDGREIVSNGHWVSIDGEDHFLSCFTGQSSATPWGVGEHTVTAQLMNVTTTFTATVEPNPVVSFTVEDIVLTEGTQTEYGYTNGDGEWLTGKRYWYEDSVRYTVTLTDGTVLTGSHWEDVYFNGRYYALRTKDDQPAAEGWDVGVHTVTAELMGKETTFNVEISDKVETDSYTYLITQNGVVIIDCLLSDSQITIPSQLDGHPVVGVASMQSAGDTITGLTIPDSVTSLGQSLFRGMYGLETLTVGAGVTYLSPEMLDTCYLLNAIHVSEDNETYTSVNGIVYDKDVTTLLIYPLNGPAEYELPASVTDIGLLSDPAYQFVSIRVPEDSDAFCTVNGVVYTKDMTTILSVEPGISGDYVMPDTVTTIMNGAFEGAGITSLTVSAGVTDIAYSVFAGCTSLQSVTLPKGLVSIGDYAFAECTALKSIALQEGLLEIGDSAFKKSGLTSVSLPDSLVYLGDSSFKDSAIVTLDLGSGLAEISPYAFANTKLASLTLPENIEYVAYYAFSGTALTSVLIPENVGFGSGVFSGCKKLTGVTFEPGVSLVSSHMFSGSGLKKVVLHENIVYVGIRAFQDCLSLTEAVFENEGIYIDDYAFAGCPLKEVDLGDKVTSINKFTFAETAITKLTVPTGVTEIMYGAFEGCEDLASITVPTNVTYVGGRVFYHTAWYNSQKAGPVYLNHILYRYKGDVPAGTVFVPKSGTTVIASYAFDNDEEEAAYDAHDTSGLTEVILRYGTVSIGEYAFANCDGLKYITIPETVININYNAFRGTDITIRGKAGSFAEEYADLYGIPFEEACTHKTLTTVKAKEATLFATGLTAGEKCASCDTVMVKQEVTAKKTLSGTTLTVSSATASSIKVTWNAVSGATGYRVYNQTIGKYFNVTGTSYTFTGLSANQAYQLQVRPYAESGSTVVWAPSWSAAVTGRTLLATPTVTAAGTTAANKATWNKIAGATGYTVYSRYYKDGKWSGWKNLGNTTTLSYTDTKATAGLYYQYTVRAYNGNAASLSAYKASGNAVRLAQPTVKAVGTTAANKVTWNKVTGAAGYTVYYRYYKSGKWTGWNRIGNTTKLAYDHTKATAGLYYQYTVKAYNGTSVSTYKASGNAVRLAQPTVKAVGTTAANQVTWNKVAGAAGYTVYYRYYKSGKWTGWTKIGNTTKLAYNHTKATAGVYYQYTVKAYNGTSTSTYKASGNAVRLAQPKVTTVKSGTAFKSTWKKSAGAKGYVVYRRQYNASTKKWSGWTKMTTTTALTYTDKTAKKGVYYQYTARAYNGTSQSSYAAGNQVKR